jgi:hypothetical protein
MIKIAHRGNVIGPFPQFENMPNYILAAIKEGYDVEVDVWWHDNAIYFGHDFPQYFVSPEEFYQIRPHAWFHCKNLNALNHFIENHADSNFFWHQVDDFALVSSGHIWTYPLRPTTYRSILVDLDLTNKENHHIPAGICTDYPSLV